MKKILALFVVLSLAATSARAELITVTPFSVGSIWTTPQTLLLNNGGVFTADYGGYTTQDTSKTAYSVYSPVVPSGWYFADNFRSVLDLEPGTTVQNADAYGAYIFNNITQGSAPNQANAVAFFSVAVNNVAGAATFGLNPTCSDGGYASTCANEFDFTANNAGSEIEGLSLILQGSAQPTGANALQVNISSGSTAKWVNGLVLNNGAVTSYGVILGALATSGDNIAALPVASTVFNSSGTQLTPTFQAIPLGARSAFTFIDNALSGATGIVLANNSSGNAPQVFPEGSATDISLFISGKGAGSVQAGSYLLPYTDATYGLGSSSFRWNTIYGVTGYFGTLVFPNGSGSTTLAAASPGSSAYTATFPAASGTVVLSNGSGSYVGKTINIQTFGPLLTAASGAAVCLVQGCTAGGTGWGTSASGTLTLSGGGATCSTYPVFNATTNGSGVVTVGSVSVAGSCSVVPSNEVLTWTAGGGLSQGSGLIVNVTWAAVTQTYTPTTGISSACFYGYGAGGGGGGGALEAASTAASGGGGGGGGAFKSQCFTAAQIGSSQSISVGIAARNGGLPATTTTTAGSVGVQGGPTTVGSNLMQIIGGCAGAGGQLSATYAGGGGGAGGSNCGNGGSGTAGSAGGGGSAGSSTSSATSATSISGGGGGAGSDTGGVAHNGGGAFGGGTGGGSGGGLTSLSGTNAGGAGGGQSADYAVAGPSGGAVNVIGGAGSLPPVSGFAGYAGTGGGGGGSGATTTSGGPGGNGAMSGGGGGGGTVVNGTGSSAGYGGTGGDGYLLVVEQF